MLEFSIRKNSEEFTCKGFEELKELLEIFEKFSNEDFLCNIDVFRISD